MGKKWTKQACFKHFGIEAKNIRWSWSGRSSDGKTVAVHVVAGPLHRWRSPLSPIWCHFSKELKRLSRVFRKLAMGSRQLRWSSEGDHSSSQGCTGASPRSILECFPGAMRMRIVELDEAAGTFDLEVISQPRSVRS